MAMDITRYNKAIAAVVGSLVSVGLAWLATKTPMATCTIVDGARACAVFGMSQVELTAIIVPVVVGVVTALAPKNSMTVVEAAKEIDKHKHSGDVKKLEMHNTVAGREAVAETGPKVTLGTERK
jgi:hypothetical protein